MMARAEIRNQAAGIGASLFGTVLIFTLVIGINEFAKRENYDDRVHQAAFNIDLQPEKPESIVEPLPEPKPEPSELAPPPFAELDSDIGSVDIPVPGLDGRELDLAAAESDADADLVMTDETVDQPPQPVQQVALIYPPGARRDGVEGYVLLSLLIDHSGEVQRVRVLEAQPSGVFETAAVEAVHQWRFQPASYQGESVRVWARQKIRFSLN